MLNVEAEDKTMQGPESLAKTWKNVNGIIAGIFALILISVLPLIYRDFYFDILTVKYRFYYATVILMTVVMLITAIVFVCIDGVSYSWGTIKFLKNGFCKRFIRKSDWAMFAFLVAVAISTVQSDYIYESFWGNEGRFMGMFLILLYGVSFYIIGHCIKFKQWYLDVFLVAGMLACIIGIMQFFKYDPIGFKNHIDPKQYESFTSTIGNINTYTSYVALISGMSTVLFSIEKNRYRKVWYLFCVVVSIFALITGISDNAYLAILALFGLLPLYLFNSIKGLKKYMMLVAILFTEFQLIDSISRQYPDHVLKINGLFDVIVGYDKLTHLVFALWGIYIILCVLTFREQRKGELLKECNIGRWIWLCLIVVTAVAVVYVLYDANAAGNAERYGSLKKYLVFNDDWGTHRWYIWRIGMESYEEFPLHHKIFGYGPDTFGIITVKNHYNDMVSRYNEIFDSAHNEYLQYLITIGIVGLVSYLALLGTSIYEMIKAVKKQPVIMAITFAIICYGAQAAVNISVPIVAPVMMTLIMIGVAAAGQVNSSK